MGLLIDRRAVLSAAAMLGGCTTADKAPPAPEAWRRLPTEAYPGKQDDVVFVDRDRGWYGNGKGRIFRTTDGGETWRKVLDQPGTYVRALGFVDAKVGVMGNIGPGSFPGVTDSQPLYRTVDGGESWAPVQAIAGPAPKGICAIDVLHYPYVNAGVLARRTLIHAAGRVGGPAFVLRSTDEGASWTSTDLSAQTGMILDIRFLDERVGFIAGSSDADVETSHARVLKTTDGGRTWRTVYESRRPWEITWKLSFPSRRVGYVTVQSYNPDKTVAQRYVAKTVDGGETWREMPVVADPAFMEFGVAFVDERRGWVGGARTGMETRDGGRSWTPVEIGRAANKIRVVRDERGTVLYAIGVNLYRLDLPR